MDGRTSAAVACSLSGGTWLLLGATLLGRRLRHRRRTPAPTVLLPPVLDAHLAPWAAEEEWLDGLSRAEALAAVAAGGAEQRALLRRAVWSNDPDARRASVTALGRLALEHEWAVDALIEALAEQRDAPAHVAAQLDRVAPRAGTRLAPLLGHPSSMVRFTAVRLLARYPGIGRRLVPGLTHDPSPHVRAAALETMRTVATAEAARRALELLDDPHPVVRSHACRAATAISGAAVAPYVAPLLEDPSAWVREAAHEALVAAGPGVASAIRPTLESENADLRVRAALVLQDVGVVDRLVADASDPGLLEQIFAAGGARLRGSATARARSQRRLGHGRPLASGAEP
jgi:HEAT repeat protein